MSAFNIVRIRAKPGCEKAVVDAHREIKVDFPGFIRGCLIRTGDRTYCMVGEWDRQSSIDAAEKDMIGILDRFRDALEDLGSGLGVTDPIAGEVVVEINTQ